MSGIEQILEGITTPEEVLKELSLIKTEQSVRSYDDADVQQLETAYKNFLQTHDFQTGQIVKWKKGLKNKNLPQENQPAIVLKVLDKPLYLEGDSGSPYFREPLDIVLAIINDDGDFLTFYYEKRRFEPYNS
ncbi:MAG: hypothetical protein ABFS56_16630 [Pseudomonadota bacterium]